MKTNNFAFIRYLNKNEVIKSHLIVFNKMTMMVHKVIVQVGLLAKFQAQQKAIVTTDH